MHKASSHPQGEPVRAPGLPAARGPPTAAPETGSPPRWRALAERAHDLQWLVALAGQASLQAFLAQSTRRLESALGALYVPERHLCLLHPHDSAAGEPLAILWKRARNALLSAALQKREPLVLNSGRDTGPAMPNGKILVAPIAAEDGPVLGVLAFFRLQEAPNYRRRDSFLAAQLGRLAVAQVESRFDPLTGLLTLEALEQRYAHAAPDHPDSDESVIYLDVDQMHVVNELYGFEIGNELLARIAELLAPPRLPQGARAARISADRFVVVLPNADTQAALAFAERLQGTIHALTIGPVDDPIEVSVSCGIAALLAMPQRFARALAAAEFACKTAKQAGRNRLKIDSCDDGTMLRGHIDAVTVGQLRTALKSDQLLLYAQPIVPLRDAALPGGYEVLLRLNDASEGVVQPGTLVKVAGRYQLLPLIDRWVVRRALKLLAAHRKALESHRLGISINLSGQSIGDEEFTRQLGEALRAAQLPAGCLTFEITEQAAVSSLARAEEMIRRLSRWNCRFALDDFGTGSNSLAYLNALPIARVKIDGTFVHDILTNPRSQATVRGIVELARGFSIDTVAEFVETRAIADRVRELGVDYAQGFAFGKPEPLEGMLAGLSSAGSQPAVRQVLEA